MGGGGATGGGEWGAGGPGSSDGWSFGGRAMPQAERIARIASYIHDTLKRI